MYTAKGIKTTFSNPCIWRMKYLPSVRYFSVLSKIRNFTLEGRFKEILTPSYLEEKANQFDRDGYTILDELYSSEMIDEFRNEMDKLIQEEEANQKSSPLVFDGKSQSEELNKSIDYFLKSASNISFLYESGVFDENGKLKRPIKQCLNKIGYAIHDINPYYKKFSYSNVIKTICASILKYRNPILAQSMYIFKSAKVGGEIIPHQDSSYLTTNPLTCKGFWFALDDADENNGCLWGIPGSHKTVPINSFWKLKTEKIYDKDGKYLKTESTLFYEPEATPKYEVKNEVPLRAKKGSVVLFDGSLIHFSHHNYSERSRHAYTLHVVESEAEWLKTNWLQRVPELPFKLLYESKF